MNDAEFQTYDYAIGGKLVVGKATLDESYMVMLQDGDAEAKRKVKSQLVHQMAEFMLENNLVEFTQYKDPIMFNTTVAVRAYIAPNDQVKVLRLANKIV